MKFSIFILLFLTNSILFSFQQKEEQIDDDDLLNKVMFIRKLKIIEYIPHDTSVGGTKQMGYSYYTKLNLDTMQNKSIGEIIKSLESQNIINCTFDARQYAQNHNSSIFHETFDVFIKNSDTTTILLKGYVKNQLGPLNADSSDIFKEFLKQTMFNMQFFEININNWKEYTKIYNHKYPFSDKDYLSELPIFVNNYRNIFYEDKYDQYLYTNINRNFHKIKEKKLIEFDTTKRPIIFNTLRIEDITQNNFNQWGYMQKYCLEYLQDNNLKNYEGKSIGEILNYLGDLKIIHFNRLSKTVNYVNKKEITTNRCEFYLKKNDSIAIYIPITLDNTVHLSDSLEIAFIEILKIDKYYIDFYEINIHHWYDVTKTFNFKGGNNGLTSDLPELKLFKENFPKIFNVNK